MHEGSAEFHCGHEDHGLRRSRSVLVPSESQATGVWGAEQDVRNATRSIPPISSRALHVSDYISAASARAGEAARTDG